MLSKSIGELAVEMFRAAEASAANRLEAETQAARATRAKYKAEIAETDALLEQAGDTQAALRERIERLEAAQAALNRQLDIAEGKVAEPADRIVELSRLLSEERQLRAKSVQALTSNLPDDQAIHLRANTTHRKLRHQAAVVVAESAQP